MKKIFFTLFVITSLFGKCQDKQEDKQKHYSNNNIISTSWEDGDILQHIFLPHSLCMPYSGTITDSIARKGKKSVRFELHSSDPICAGSKRAELYISSKTTVEEKFTWYAWSEFLPTDYAYDEVNELHFQIHDKFGQGPPSIGLWVSKDKWHLIQTYNPDDLLNKKSTIKSHDLGPVLKGQWVDWVLHVNFSAGDDGVLQLWRNDTLLLDLKGCNVSKINGRQLENPYMKFGIYKWQWKDKQGPFNPDTRVTFFDELKMGKEGASIEDFIIRDDEQEEKKKKQ